MSPKRSQEGGNQKMLPCGGSTTRIKMKRRRAPQETPKTRAARLKRKRISRATIRRRTRAMVISGTSTPVTRASIPCTGKKSQNSRGRPVRDRLIQGNTPPGLLLSEHSAEKPLPEFKDHSERTPEIHDHEPSQEKPAPPMDEGSARILLHHLFLSLPVVLEPADIALEYQYSISAPSKDNAGSNTRILTLSF